MAASFSQLRPPSLPLFPPSCASLPLAVVRRRRRDNYALSLMKIYRFCALGRPPSRSPARVQMGPRFPARPGRGGGGGAF